MSNKIISSYAALKNALAKGAQRYIQFREKGEKPNKNYPDTGWFHGKKGMTKAINLAKYAQINDMENLCVLALALAIFRSSSSWLATEIAYELITGDSIQRYGLCHNNLPREAHTLTSDAFDMKSEPVEIKRYDRTYSKTIVSRRLIIDNGITNIHKKKTVTDLLEKAATEVKKSEGVTADQFESRVLIFQKILEVNSAGDLFRPR